MRKSDFIQLPDVLPNATWSRAGERFGEFLSAGQLDTTIGIDLAIAMPYSSFEQGRVIVTPGSATGLRKDGSLLIDDGLEPPPSFPRYFGWSISPGDFNGDGVNDLVVSAPIGNTNGTLRSGVVEVLYNGCLLCDGFESGSTSAWN